MLSNQVICGRQAAWPDRTSPRAAAGLSAERTVPPFFPAKRSIWRLTALPGLSPVRPQQSRIFFPGTKAHPSRKPCRRKRPYRPKPPPRRLRIQSSLKQESRRISKIAVCLTGETTGLDPSSDLGNQSPGGRTRPQQKSRRLSGNPEGFAAFSRFARHGHRGGTYFFPCNLSFNYGLIKYKV